MSTPDHQPAHKERKRRRRLTVKQRKLLNYILDNPDCTLREAGLAAGYNEGGAAVMAAGAMKTKTMQERLADMMEADPRLKSHALLEKLKDGLESNKVTYSPFKGELGERAEDPDMGIRKEYLKLAFQLNGGIVAKQEISGGAKPIQTVDLSFLDTEKLLKLIEETK